MNAAEPVSPYQTVIVLLQAITWAAVITATIFVIRFISKAENKLEDANQKVNEMHKCVTNHLVHSADEAVEFLKKQDQRWDTYLLSQRAAERD